MPEVVILLLAACGTALATGLGAVPVFLRPAIAVPFAAVVLVLGIAPLLRASGRRPKLSRCGAEAGPLGMNGRGG